MAPTRIVVVDDDPAIRAVLGEWLALVGYAPVAFGNGAEALTAVRANPPDLILLDYVLPGLDGPTILRALQADPRLQTIPVIVLTGSTEDVPPQPGIAAILGKPFRLEALADAVRALLERNSVR